MYVRLRGNCCAVVLSAFIAVAWMAPPSQATTDVWKAAVSEVWGVGTNWADGTTPILSDTANFNLPGVYTVSFNATPQAISALTLTNSANVTFASASRPPNPIATRTLPVNFPGSPQDIQISNNAALTLGTASGGFPSSSQPFNLTAGDDLFVGSGSALNVRFASQLTVGDQVFISNGTLNVTNGGRVRSANMRINEQGVMNVTSGPVQIDDFAQITGGDVNDATAIVSGSNSRWEIANDLDIYSNTFVASTGRGVLNVTGGAQVRVGGNTIIGHFDGVGVVTVADAGSLLTTGALNVGNSSIFQNNPGPGTLNIQPGATVKVNGLADIFAQGRVRLLGGAFDTASLRIENNGQFEWTAGTLHVGTYLGNLSFSAGTLAPGHSAGSTTITGNYTQQGNGVLEIEIGGASQISQYDALSVSGNATLGGLLDVHLIDNFLPAANQTFIIANANTAIAGAFSNAPNGSRLSTTGGGSFQVNYGAGSAFDPTLLVLSNFLAAGIPGDYNQNGVVDAADYTIWRDRLGQTGSLPNDDTPGVGPDDYTRWKSHFGESTGPASVRPETAVVPEPTTSTALIISLLVVVNCRGLTHARRIDCWP